MAVSVSSWNLCSSKVPSSSAVGKYMQQPCRAQLGLIRSRAAAHVVEFSSCCCCPGRSLSSGSLKAFNFSHLGCKQNRFLFRSSSCCCCSSSKFMIKLGICNNAYNPILLVSKGFAFTQRQMKLEKWEKTTRIRSRISSSSRGFELESLKKPDRLHHHDLGTDSILRISMNSSSSTTTNGHLGHWSEIEELDNKIGDEVLGTTEEEHDGHENFEEEGEGEGEEDWGSDYWSKQKDTTTTTWISPDAAAADVWVEEDLNKRIRFQNGREVFEERAYLVGIERKGAAAGKTLFSITESLEELSQLADTAGLAVVGSTYQKLEHPSPKTYIGAGKVSEVATAIRALKIETVVFDDELSPGQLRSLGKAFGEDVRVCDRTALILDIFSQRAATREATLQVELAQTEYQLPRLTRMWTHLERQAGGLVKGMGEKQIEVDKRILRTQIAQLKRELESVRGHRQQYRDRRASVPIPVVSLVGYTNAGKSTLLNRLSGAGVLAEDRLFATLDPTTRRVELPNGKECLFTDTVGFIQKLPTQLVAAFRATLEEISDSSLLVHVIDISHPMASQQREAVDNVLAELDVNHIPLLCVWNKVDRAEDPEALRAEAARRGNNIVCMSALTGEGMPEFYEAVEQKIKESMVRVEAVVPYGQGELINLIHRLGIVELEDYRDKGTLIRAHVPLPLSKQLLPLRQPIL
ncbi:unnamed protein product [Sphagnum jensenii]|uniref:Hflx-type G domain-containing protein n=1 Tax=Sphagnum jensenii TaxID=128206 RepID=A0ABP0WT39_9BRYO